MSDKLKKIVKKEILEKQLGGRAASTNAPAAPANSAQHIFGATAGGPHKTA